MIRHVTSQRQDGGRGNMLVTCPTPSPPPGLAATTTYAPGVRGAGTHPPLGHGKSRTPMVYLVTSV